MVVKFSEKRRTANSLPILDVEYNVEYVWTENALYKNMSTWLSSVAHCWATKVKWLSQWKKTFCFTRDLSNASDFTRQVNQSRNLVFQSRNLVYKARAPPVRRNFTVSVKRILIPSKLSHQCAIDGFGTALRRDATQRLEIRSLRGISFQRIYSPRQRPDKRDQLGEKCLYAARR